MPLSETDLNEHLELEKLIKEHEKDPSWVKDESQMGVEIFSKVVKNPITQGDVPAVLGVAEVPHSAEACIAAYWDNALRLEWDNKNVAISETVEEIDPATEVVYRVSNNLPWPLSQRETVARSHETREADGSLFLSWKSVVHAKKQPNSSYVVGYIIFGAFWVRPLSEKSCKVVFSVAYDPSGNIPYAMVSKSVKTAPLIVRGLQSFLDKPENFNKAQAVVERKRAKRAAAGISP